MSRYWVGGDGNWSNTAHWAASSGGAGGETVPDSATNVIFDSASHTTAYTVTVDATANCADLTFAAAGDGGKPTLRTPDSANILFIYGSLSLVSGMAFGSATGSSGRIEFKAASGIKTITTNSVVLTAAVVFSAAGTFQLSDNLSIGGDRYLSNTAGTFDPNGKAVIFVGTANSIYSGFTGSSSLYDLIRTGTATKTDVLNISADVTVTHNLTINGNSATNRVLVQSSVKGTARTITVGGTKTLTNVDLQDITWGSTNSRTISGTADDGGGKARFATAAAHNLIVNDVVYIAGTTNYNGSKVVTAVSDTTHFDTADAYVSSQAGTWTLDISAITGLSSDCGGNTGFTFTPAATQYWYKAAASSENWSTAGNWYLGTGGTGGAGRVPLAQDTARFDVSSFPGVGQYTVTQDMPRIGSVDWTGATNALPPIFTTSTAASVFGSITLISGMTLTASTQTYTFEGRGANTLTSAGKTWAKAFVLSAPGGSLTVQDALTNTAGLVLNAGTFNSNNQTITLDRMYDTGTYSPYVTLVMGASTWVLTRSVDNESFWSIFSTTTITANTSTIKATGANPVIMLFAGGSKTYNNLWLAPGSGTGTFRFTGSNTFSDFKDDGTAAHSILFTEGTTTTAATWNISGAPGAVRTIGSMTAAGHTLAKSGGGSVVAKFVSVSYSTASPANMFFACNNSTDGGNNSGWVFLKGTGLNPTTG